MDHTHGRTVVLGLGNPILSDDSVGLAVAATLRTKLAAAPVRGVDVYTSTRAGFELIDILQGYRRAIIVDCLTLHEPEPGRIHRLSLNDVSGSSRLIGGHDVSIAQAFELAARLGVPMPAEVEIIAIEAADTCTLAEDLSPAVAGVVAPLSRELYEQLARSEPPEDPAPPDGRQAFYGADGM